MAAGLTDKLVDMADIARLIDDAEMRATVQKRVAAPCVASIKLRHDRSRFVLAFPRDFCYLAKWDDRNCARRSGLPGFRVFCAPISAEPAISPETAAGHFRRSHQHPRPPRGGLFVCKGRTAGKGNR